MIKFIVLRKDEANYNSYIGKSLRSLNVAQSCDINVLDPKLGISHYINKGIEAFLKTDIKSEDILVFAHEDVNILDPFFIQKLETVFRNKPEIGIVGIAGTTEIDENLVWFKDNKKIYGQWINNFEDKTKVMGVGNVGYFDNIVAIHKCFVAIRLSLIKEGLRFDENLSRDLYMVDLCFQVLDRGYKVAIADILLQHKSIREGNWEAKYVVDKYKNMGYSFPITVDQFKLDQLEGVSISL